MLENTAGRSADWERAESWQAIKFRSGAGRAAVPHGGLAKRCLDVALSLLLVPIVALVALPVALLIAVKGGAPIYGHLRVGWNGRLFRCYKFRTMVAEAEDELQAILDSDPAARLEWLERFKLANDPRVTPFGRFLRTTNLDEIPQIWNVLRGEMSWVGPRPVIPDELAKYGAHLGDYLACRPGVSGLWQIRRRGDTTYDERVAMDVEYARHWSIARDLAILVLTIPWMLAARNLS